MVKPNANGMNESWKFSSLDNTPITLVLMGRTGNGKSATGNSIMGRRAFKVKSSSSGVTKSSELKSTEFKDGRVINVVDTPGLFDMSAGPDYIAREIVKCIDMSKDGIHAVLIVFSVRTRFSEEEGAALQSLQKLLGSKILDYTIIVFTGGDELEDNEQTLEDYLGNDCPVPLRDMLATCQNRCVLFDNKTKNETKKFQQLRHLFSLVDAVIKQNGGQPYTHGLITESKIEKRVDEVKRRLEEQLEQERLARIKAEENAQKIKNEYDIEIHKLNEELRKARQPVIRNGGGGGCTIL